MIFLGKAQIAAFGGWVVGGGLLNNGPLDGVFSVSVL